MAITTNRDVYLAGHTTREVYNSLRDEATRRKISISRLIHELVVDGLRRRGHRVVAREFRVAR